MELDAPPPPPPPSTGTRRKENRKRRLLLSLVLPLATVVAGVALGVGVAASIDRPQVEEIAPPNLVTRLHDRDGVDFRTYFRERRILLDPTELPLRIEQAILAAEDASFYQHGGIDLAGIVRAAVKNVRAGRSKEGASTLTMQLARTLFLSREKKLKRKIEEAFLAVDLEKTYSKKQILTLYANLMNFSEGNYGVEAAARDYFSKPAAELDAVEAATLAGILQRPSDYSPRRKPELVQKRRNYVLRRMLEEGFIDRAEHDRAIELPVIVAPRQRVRHVGPYFAEEVRRHLISTYGEKGLYDRGLQVHTTLDQRIQRAAEESLHEALVALDHENGWRGPLDRLEDTTDLSTVDLPSWTDVEPLRGEWFRGVVLESDATTARVRRGESVWELGAAGIAWTGQKSPDDVVRRGDIAWFRRDLPPKDDDGDGDASDDATSGEWIVYLEQEPELEGAAVVVESATGAVRGLVGGWSYERNEFDRAMQAQRQVGSAFKPFVFGAALEKGFTPADRIFDGPVVFLGADQQPSYSPRNYYRKYYGMLTLRRAIELSINVTSVKLLDLVGAEHVIDFAQRSGVTSELPPYPSLALGVADMSPLELAASYATFANLGVHVEPYLVERVETRDGRLLEEHRTQARTAVDPAVAAVVSSVLRGVVLRGTGQRLARYDVEVAGKTGTTNDYTDAWFAGFVPEYTIVTWVGYDKKRRMGRGMTGAKAALPIWQGILERGLEEGWIEVGGRLPRPSGVVEEEIEPLTGLLASGGAPSTIDELFLDGTTPTRAWTREDGRIVDLPWYLQEPFYLPKEGERMPADIDDWSLVQDVWAGVDEEERAEAELLAAAAEESRAEDLANAREVLRRALASAVAPAAPTEPTSAPGIEPR